ncbi:MAG: transketolase [Candidatus Aenigmarchaeota archaeon]|nr:transketolase [Candidatus Aenigmarchaeota archaeon]
MYQFVLSLKEEAAIHRINTLHAIAGAGSGHPGGSFSAAEIATCLFSVFMKYDSATPYAEQRDRFILSKGHGVPIVYAALAGHGFFPIDELAKLRRLGGLPGHASHVTPGIDAPTGSLGQGLSIAQGIAEAVSCKGIRANVYVVLGDGELQEGQVWEAARVIGAANTRNVIAFIDANGVQQTAPVESVSSVSPIKDKFLAFGWDAIGDDVPWGAPRESGHDFVFLINACSEALTARKPTVVLCSTVKGKGVSFMENKAQWHGKAPKGGEYAQAIEELTASRAAAVEGYEKLKTSL